ncbi:MAG: hypothetical protein LBQ49_02165 [Rickettsiales bacterium]|jgi:hypothetical protein|nr:hypothetical protein [Rickettsiales bacterium]
MNVLVRIYKGGILAGHRTYLIAFAGIMSALSSYLAGDSNLLETLNAIFPLAAIYYLRKGINDEKPA